MNLEDRDYKFSDEQVKELGFESYEELEKYYDIDYFRMDKNNPWTKQQCHNHVKINEYEYLLDLPRRERLKKVLEHEVVDDLLEWDDCTNIPYEGQIERTKKEIIQLLDIYCNYCEKQRLVDKINVYDDSIIDGSRSR